MDSHTTDPISLEETKQKDTTVYPPKYVKEKTVGNVWLKSAISLAVYLLLGFYLFRSSKVLLLITVVVIIHELGHFLAMKFFRYKDLGIFFIPLLGAYVSGTKREVSQRESAIILLAGPLPGIVLGILFYLLYQQNPFGHILGIGYNHIAILFVFLNVLNLIPIYPLDGGQLLNRVLFDNAVWPSRIFIFLSIAFMAWFAINTAYYPLLFFPALMLLRFFQDNRSSSLEKRIEESGIDLDIAYEDLPDEDYWKIRAIIIQEHPTFKEVESGPPFEYSDKEDRIAEMVKNMLHRHLIQDLSISDKLLIFAICATAIATPWIFKMDILRHFNFG